MNKAIVAVIAFFAFNAFHIKIVNACGSFTTPCASGGEAENFVPNFGSLSAYTENDQRIVAVSFQWSNISNLEFLKANMYHTLEPDAEFWGPNHFAQKIALPYDYLDLGQILPLAPIVVTSSSYPFPYADAVIFDDDPRFITVGSAHAFLFEPNVLYRTRSKTTSAYTGASNFGPMALRFQRGKWVFEPDVTDVEDYIGLVCGFDLTPNIPYDPLVPNYAFAPLCIFSCCDALPSAQYVVPKSENVVPPNCKIWNYNYSSGTSSIAACTETNCADGSDNDVDGLTDCDDPDCENTAYCGTLIDPPLDPCGTTTSGNGYYCGQNQEIHEGNFGELYYCYNGMASDPPQGSPEPGPCPDNNCIVETPGTDDHCFEPGCTQICSTNETRCSGNNVEICAPDQCSFVYDHGCGSQTCISGQCITQADPPPNITSVSCTNTMRGESATCTIYGSNLNCGNGSNTYIAGLFGGHVPCSSTQITVSGTWACIEPLGLKQVSHKNPDNQRDDTFNLVNLQMGELRITSVWQQTVHEGAINVPMGANGCNFGQNPVFYAEFIDVGQTAYLSAENQVLATGNVAGTTANSPVDVCVAKFPNSTDPFDKKCWDNYIQIIP